MNENMKLLLNWMKQYIEEPNAPDYSGEYPPCWEITQEEVSEILDYINQLQQENNALNQTHNYDIETIGKVKGDCVKLSQENKQLKEQLEFEKQCQNRFFKVNNKTYDGRIVLELLKQRDEVIEETINTIGIIVRDFEENEVPLKINDLDNLLEILQKYKGDNK